MTTNTDDLSVIIGGGPAGLTAAYELTKLGRAAVVLEQDQLVGGISRTVEYKGYRFDIGGHRFFTKVALVQQIWEEILGEEFLVRPRLSRIYYQNHFFDYPLKPVNALVGLGPLEAVRIGLSYAKVHLFPLPEERNFEQWVTNRFGRRLYEIFFKTYTEKVWGIPCTEIGADWAAQRIKNLDLVAALKNALLGSGSRAGGGEVITTLIDEFYYPRLGPGMMWERCRDRLAAQGVETRMGARVTRLHHDGERITAAGIADGDGGEERLAGNHFISSMPVTEVVAALDPPSPEMVELAGRLRYRDFLTVSLIIDRPELFPDNWIYIHSADVRLGRIQNFKNWSPEMVPDPSKSCLGLEYFVQEGDDLWEMADEDLVELGRRECAILGLVDPDEVIDGTVVRMPKAYPVYDQVYLETLERLRAYLDGFTNLQLIGRNGQHRYNNQDHSMLAGVYAARNIDGADYDVWAVNTEQEYHEEVRDEAAGGDRLVPGAVPEADVEELLADAFARYDPVAMGSAVGSVAGLGLALATAALLLRGGDVVGPNLSLLGNYLFGFTVSWSGLAVGLVEGAVGGFAGGYALARIINRVVAWHESALVRKLQIAQTMNPFEEG